MITGAAAGHQHAKPAPEALPPAEAEVTQLPQGLLLGDYQTSGLVPRVAQRKRILLILGPHVGRVLGRCVVLLTHGYWLISHTPDRGWNLGFSI